MFHRLLIACALLGVAHDAAAQEVHETVRTLEPTATQAKLGPQLGARTGFGFGAGSVYSGLAVIDTANGAIPIIVDVGWRFLPGLYAGLYGQVAPVFVKTNPIACPDGLSCAAQDWRFGVQVDYHFLPRNRLDPYVGFGAGYEILHETQGGVSGGQTFASDVTERGWELGSLTLGFDWRTSHGLGVGPFLTGTIAEYDTQTGTFTVNGAPQPLANGARTAHELFVFGVRATINP